MPQFSYLPANYLIYRQNNMVLLQSLLKVKLKVYNV